MKIVFDSKLIQKIFDPKNIGWTLYVLAVLLFALAGLIDGGFVPFLVINGFGCLVGGFAYAAIRSGRD